MEELKLKIKKYIQERGWTILKKPASIAKSISIESAELLEIFQWEDYSLQKIKKDPVVFQNVKEELADILIYCIEMSVSLDLNIEEIINQKLEKNTKKYPVSVVKNNQKAYLKIKQDFRNKRST